MHRRLHTLGRAASALALVGLGACNDFDFEQQDEISKLRTLGIRLEPPELAPGTVVLADSLTVDPRGAGPVRYAWELCAFHEGPDEAYACATDDEGNPMGMTIAETPTATIPYDAVVAVLGTADELCAALEGAELPEFVEVPACDRGFPLTVRMTARVGAGQGEDEEIAVKQLLLLREGVTPNENPRIDGLLVADQPAVAGGPLVVPTVPGEPVVLEALVDAEQAETYEHEGEARTEQLALSWYTTRGRIDRPVTWYDAERVPIEELRENELDVEGGVPAEPGDVVTLWLVLRDDRGGTAFASAEIQPDL